MGNARAVGELFEAHASSIHATPRNFVFRYRSPAHWLDVFRTYYGPVLKTFGALEPSAQRELEQDLLALVTQFNRANDGSMVVPSEYLEVVIRRA